MSSRPSHSPHTPSPHPTELINAFREVNRELKTQELLLAFSSTAEDWELGAGDDLWHLNKLKTDALVEDYIVALQSQQIALNTKVEELEKQVEELRIQQLAGSSYTKNQRRAIDGRYHDAYRAEIGLAKNSLQLEREKVLTELTEAKKDWDIMTQDLQQREKITRQIDQLNREMKTLSSDIIPDDVLTTRMQAHRENMTHVLGELKLSSAPVSTSIQKTIVGVKNKTHVLVKRAALIGAVLGMALGLYLANTSTKKRRSQEGGTQELKDFYASRGDDITQKFLTYIETQTHRDTGLSLDFLQKYIAAFPLYEDDHFRVESISFNGVESFLTFDNLELQIYYKYRLQDKKTGKVLDEEWQIRLPDCLNKLETPSHLPADIGGDTVKFHQFKSAFLERAQKQFPKGNIFNLEILDMMVISQQNNWDAMTAELTLTLITNRGQVEVKRTAKLLPEQNRF